MASIGNLRMATRLMRAGSSLRYCSSARMYAPALVHSKFAHTGQLSGFPLLRNIKIQSTSSIRFTSSLPKLSEDDVRTRVLSVCKNFDKINAEKLNLETHFMNDLGLDSLDHVELIMAMEDEFGFEITDSDAEKLIRPAEIVKYVVARYEARELEH